MSSSSRGCPTKKAARVGTTPGRTQEPPGAVSSGLELAASHQCPHATPMADHSDALSQKAQRTMQPSQQHAVSPVTSTVFHLILWGCLGTCGLVCWPHPQKAQGDLSVPALQPKGLASGGFCCSPTFRLFATWAIDAHVLLAVPHGRNGHPHPRKPPTVAEAMMLVAFRDCPCQLWSISISFFPRVRTYPSNFLAAQKLHPCPVLQNSTFYSTEASGQSSSTLFPF